MAVSKIPSDMPQKKKNELLLLASYHYDVSSVQEFLAAGADVNYQDPWTGHTPLFANFTKLMRSPKRYELNPTTGKITPTLGNYSDVFNLLVANGAQINVVDAKQVSPLEYAVQGNDPLIVDTLLKIGADVNTTDKHGNPLLSLILDLNPTRRLSRSENEIGPGLESQGDMRESWVHRSDQRVMNLFINYGANVNKPNRIGITPLMKAVALCGPRRRDVSYYQRILQDGYLSLIHVTSSNDRGVVRLALLNSNTYPWILKSLLNFTLRHRYLEIPLQQLVRNNVDDAVRLLDDWGSDIFAFAIKSDNMDLFKMLLKSGEMPEISHWIPNHSDDIPVAFALDVPVTPLFLAFWIQSPEYIKTLLDFQFVNSFDLKTPSELLLRLKSHIMTDKKCPETVELYYDFYETPKTLMTLSFVAVSTGVGFHSNRRDRVSQTMLPLPLQRMLMFGAQESRKAVIKPSPDEDESDNYEELLSSEFDFDISDNFVDFDDLSE